MSGVAAASIEDRCAGSMLGLALGDALGAPHEGGPFERALWALLGLPHGRLLRWTDDTQMSVAAAESLLQNGGLDPDDLARRWAGGARLMRGYGPGTWKLLARVRSGESWKTASRAVFPDGSFGNGAAMRAAPFALYFRGRPEELEAAAARSAAVTHAHPLGVEGCVLVAHATALALDDGFAPRDFLEKIRARSRREEFLSRLDWAIEALTRRPSPDEVRERLGNGVAAHESVATALYAFARHHDDFAALMDFVVAVGGDADTIGAMAGGIFGARNGAGALPSSLLDRLEERGRIESLGLALARRR